MTNERETIERSARSAAGTVESDATHASPSPSKTTARAGFAGTAAGPAGNSATRLSAEAVEWIRRERGISRATLERMPVGSGTALFREGRKKAIFFRYPGGWKARGVGEKCFVASQGFKGSFWNLEAVLSGDAKSVYATEGEMDCLALVEAGVPADAVLSVPNGAHERPADNPAELRGYDYVREALAAGLNKATRIVWCGDGDGPGLALRADMARIFGAAKFHFVVWPDGCKDANDVLRSDGPKFLFELATEGSLPWPVAGIYRLSELPEPGPMTIWYTGFDEWNDKIRLSPTNLSVVTGHPGHGKSAAWGQIWYNVVHRYGIPICVASFETRPKPHMRRQLRTLKIGCLERDMSEKDRQRADEWIDERYLFLVHPDQRPTLEWFLDMAEVAVVRHGARIIQVDPWNRLEAAREGRESETDYIGRCLRTIHTFAQDLNCHVQIIAHPAKMDGARRGQPPGLEDISGCYSDDTEVLTRRGWLRHADVILEDDVACFDPAERMLQWAKPSKVWRYEHSGPMHHHRHRGGDLLVTPNHRMVVMPGWPAPSGNGGGRRPKYAHGAWQFLESNDLWGGKWLVPQSASWRLEESNDATPASLDKGYDTNAFWSYVGWWIAEGWVISCGLGVCQREEASAEIRDVIRKLGLDVSEIVSVPKSHEKGTLPMWQARVRARSHPEFTKWVINNCGVGAQNKHVPEPLWRTSESTKRIFFESLMAGDGHKHRSGWSYSTISPQLADDVQRLAIELGFSAQYRKLPLPADPKHRCRYQVNINPRKRSALHPYRNSTIEQYEGAVWCLTVPTGAYVTRRNGWASICGNSKNWENIVDQGFVMHRPSIFDGEARKTKAHLYHRKARFEELGFPCRVDLDYDLSAGKYFVPRQEQEF